MRTPSRFPRVLAPLLAAALCGCPQDHHASDTSTAGSSGSSGSPAGTTGTTSTTSTTSTDGTTTTGTTTASTGATSATAGSTGATAATGSASSSGGSTGTTACSQSGAAPQLQCTTDAAGQVIAGKTVTVTCTLVGSSEGASSYDVTTTPTGFVDKSAAVTSGKLYVTVRPQDLPTLFTDSTIAVQVTAHFCNQQDAQTVTSFNAVGNTLIVDGSASGNIATFASDGTQLTPFLGPTKVHQPTMIYRLSTGEYLVGCKLGGGCTDPLQVFTAAGQLARSFSNTDHSGGPLWVTDMGPYEAAEDSQGRVWVTAFTNSGSTSGAVLIFDTASGSFQQKGALPADPHQVISSRFAPLGIAALSDGTLLTGLLTGSGTEYVVSYADADHSQIIKLDYAQCVASAGAAPTCTHTSFGYGNISGLYVDHGRVIAGMTGESNLSIVAYQNPGLGFITGSAKDDRNNDDFYNTYFSHIVPLGDRYLAAPMFGYDCIHIIDGQTLYTPADWTKNTTGCWLNGSQLNDQIKGMYHLTAP